MFRCGHLFLLGTITLFLLTGAALGQSRTPAAPGPKKPLLSDQENVKPSSEGQQDLPLKALREQPTQVQEGQTGKSLKKPLRVKAKSTVSRGKKPGAGKSTSRANQDPFALKTESNWWPSRSTPDPSSLSSLESSLRQYPEQDLAPEEDDAEDKPGEKAEGKTEGKTEEQWEEFEKSPRKMKKFLKSQAKTQDTELNED